MPLSSNDGKVISYILDSVKCGKHKVPIGVPCFHIKHGASNGYSAGVCGKRIRSAGYVGKISSASTRSSSNRR